MFIRTLVVPTPGCGGSVNDFWGWDAHEAQLRCPDGVRGDILGNEVPGGALSLPRPWSPRGSSPYKENSHGRAGNRTRDLVISSQKLWPLDHEAFQWYFQQQCLFHKEGGILSEGECNSVTRLIMSLVLWFSSYFHGLVKQPWGFRDTISQCRHVQCKWQIHPAEAS